MGLLNKKTVDKTNKEIHSKSSKFSLLELNRKSMNELIEISKSIGLENTTHLKKQNLIFSILKSQISESEEGILGGGVLEKLNEGYGFLRTADCNYIPSSDDIYVSPAQIKLFGLRTGDIIEGPIRPPKESERFFGLLKIKTINDFAVSKTFKRSLFDNLTPIYPNEKFQMEYDPSRFDTRIIDLMCPIGKGQRALIVSPPKAGKTILMQHIANSITKNHPDVYLIVVLVDERPEEVTDMARNVNGEVVSSTFDEEAKNHVQVADMVIEKAKRLVESKKDVVILLDSITRLARAYNQVMPASGKVLSGGVDSNALHKPKKFFGAARNIEEGGSLTIIATALVDTGSRMDEVIFEEFKGTGNMEIHLDRKLSEKRVFPAIDISKSGTRKEELLISPEILHKTFVLRKFLSSMSVGESMELLLDKMRNFKTNEEFINRMNQ